MTIETELPAVKVKDLEWDNDGGWWGFYARKSIVGCYNVAQCRNEPKGDGVRSTDWFVSYPDIEALEIHPSEEAAKAAAQADYERRVLSALTLKDDPGNEEDGEAERLRHIVSDCAAALVSGAFISPKASIEFMEGLPKEISLVVSGLRTRCEKADRRIAELDEEVSSYQGLLDAAIDDYNNARNSALEEAAKLATTCIDPANRCKCSSPYEIAAAIRALIPREAK